MNRLKEKVDVIIPVCHPDKRFFKLLAGLAMQTVTPQKVYLLNVESGDYEDSCEALRERIYQHFGKRKSFGRRLPMEIELIGVSPEEFDQGGTRHEGALASKSPFLLFMSQTAVPTDEKLIEELLWSLDGGADAAYARQTTDRNAGVLETYALMQRFPKESTVLGSEDFAKNGNRFRLCSNHCAMYRRDVYMEQGGFKGPVIKNEALLFAAGVLRNGGKLAYCAQAKVTVKETNNWMDTLRNSFDDGVFFAEHPILFSRTGPEQLEFSYVKGMLQYLWNQKYYLEIVDFTGHSLFKFAGFLLGKKAHLLPAEWVKKLSMNQSYWR